MPKSRKPVRPGWEDNVAMRLKQWLPPTTLKKMLESTAKNLYRIEFAFVPQAEGVAAPTEERQLFASLTLVEAEFLRDEFDKLLVKGTLGGYRIYTELNNDMSMCMSVLETIRDIKITGRK